MNRSTPREPVSHFLILDDSVEHEYPEALVRGMMDITDGVLHGLFGDIAVCCEPPGVVRDRIIFGEVFSLIPLESAWCRGYMMMQAEQVPFMQLLEHTGRCEDPAGFRELNGMLGELTNLIWGAFKNRYMGDPSAIGRAQVQVPLLINHKQKYISFGTDNPQLCFVYRLTDPVSGQLVTLHQHFVFSLNWSPEAFREAAQAPSEPVETGALELF
ncbi:chemotaxis protein CheX [Pandoraea sp.]|uniref:chemotaxis protein CheX n=1 Tax=Pandoraea sp. TaxID=1883445 RepID=UPI0035B12E24